MHVNLKNARKLKNGKKTACYSDHSLFLVIFVCFFYCLFSTFSDFYWRHERLRRVALLWAAVLRVITQQPLIRVDRGKQIRGDGLARRCDLINVDLRKTILRPLV